MFKDHLLNQMYFIFYTNPLFFYTKTLQKRAINAGKELNLYLFKMNSDNHVITKILNNKFRGLHHSLYISLILAFWFLYSVNMLKSLMDGLKVFAYALTYVLIAYFNIYFLFKRYLITGRIITYLILSISTFLTGYLIQHLIYFVSWEGFIKEMSLTSALVIDLAINAITFLMFICIGLSFKMLKMWLHSESRLMLMEQEILKAKLSNLKSQVNPHFLFNTFNNLYVLTKTKPDLAAEMILGLSDLMRYQLNESNVEKVNIEKEINYIENLLSIEKIRKDDLEIKIKCNKNELNGIMIEPLLFITLIENAIKHGSQQMEKAFIHISIEKNDKFFTLTVLNSKPEIAIFGKEKSLGLGIENLKNRLNLLYPGRHILKLTDDKNVYVAHLQLEIE
jgi:two-component system LytT family sensor kinase